MATLKLKGDVIALDRADGLFGVETRNKDGVPTGLKYVSGVKLLPMAQAVQALKVGEASGDSIYQAAASFIAHNVSAILAEVDMSKPVDAAKAVSTRIAVLAKNHGFNMEGRGNVAGPYRSRIAKYLVAGGELKPNAKGMLPPQNAVRVISERTDAEIVNKGATDFANLIQRMDDSGLLEEFFARVAGDGYTITPAATIKTALREGEPLTMTDDRDLHDSAEGQDPAREQSATAR